MMDERILTPNTKVVDSEGLKHYDGLVKEKMQSQDQEILKQAKSYADSLGSNYDPAGTAQTKVDALEKGQVTTNKNDIATLKTGKADKATTLAGYGITDAFTKAQTKSEITTAVANAGHLKREIVSSLPRVEDADEHTIYMVPKSASKGGSNSYDEYMLVISDDVRTLEKIGDSAVDLTNYATKTEVATAKQEAISTASGDATTKANKALADAKTYSDSLAKNYATAAQGAKADTALQKASITSGQSNGSIAVGGTDVPVKGLGSAAYVATSAFDAAGTAKTQVDALANGQVTTNKNDIATLKTKVQTLETITVMSDSEIDALFA